MRKLILLTFLLFAFPFTALADNSDTLNLTIKMTRGERSRDSGSATTSITISGETIVYTLTYSGRNKGRGPEPKEFKLDAADRKRLVELIKAGNLLVTETIDRPYRESGISFYFALSVSSEVNGNKGLISIRGPRNESDMKDSKLYKDAVALIEAIYEIINRTDPKLHYEPLIH